MPAWDRVGSRRNETFDPGSGSRVTVIDSAAVNTHATAVAGTAAGDGSGSAGGRGEGVATSADVLSAGYQQSGGTMPFWDNAGDLETDLALARNTHDADLANHSIGSNVAQNGDPCSREGDYGVASSLLDGIVRGDNAAVGSALVSIWSAGNERTGQSGQRRGRCGADYATTAPPACAKNPIQVGAANSDGSSMTAFSSWGPCDDGRLKPLVVAPGCETTLVSPTREDGVLTALAGSDSAYGVRCGSSYAAAATSGVAALLIEDWRALGFGGATARPLPALVKTLLMHTARDRGQDGPDFIYGYGTIDAEALIGQLRCGTTSKRPRSGPGWSDRRL